MQFRVFALYNGSKKILLVNAALFLATALFEATFFGIQMQKIQSVYLPFPPLWALIPFKSQSTCIRIQFRAAEATNHPLSLKELGG